MTATRAITAGILGLVLVMPLAAPLCAAGTCDSNVTCKIPMRPADAPEAVRSDCCLTVPATTAVSPSPAVPMQLTATVAAAPARNTSAVMLPAPQRTGRTTSSLHRTLRL